MDAEKDVGNDIEAVAEENGNTGEHPAKRIDNGMVVRSKKLGGRSSKVIKRFGEWFLDAYFCHFSKLSTCPISNIYIKHFENIVQSPFKHKGRKYRDYSWQYAVPDSSLKNLKEIAIHFFTTF